MGKVCRYLVPRLLGFRFRKNDFKRIVLWLLRDFFAIHQVVIQLFFFVFKVVWKAVLGPFFVSLPVVVQFFIVSRKKRVIVHILLLKRAEYILNIIILATNFLTPPLLLQCFGGEVRRVSLFKKNFVCQKWRTIVVANHWYCVFWIHITLALKTTKAVETLSLGC